MYMLLISVKGTPPEGGGEVFSLQQVCADKNQIINCWVCANIFYFAGSQGMSNAFRRYWGSLRWFSIPASAGFAYICYQQFFHIKKREQRKIASGNYVPDQWQVRIDGI